MNTNKQNRIEYGSQNFESLKFSFLDDNDDILLDNSSDPDLNLFSENIKHLDTTYMLPGKLHNFLGNSVTDWFSILHLNNRSIKKNFQNFKLFLSSLQFSFSVIRFSETWLDDLDNSTYELPYYISKHQARSDRRGGGVSIYIHNSLKFKKRPDLAINNKDIESLTLEILSDKTRNVLVNVLYRPPAGQYEQFENFLTTYFSRTKSCNKNIDIAGDFNLNLLDHNTNKKVQGFLNLIYQNSLIPTINKPTRVTLKTATVIDNILTNSFTNFKSTIFKTDISDHFPICLFLPSTKVKSESETTFIYERIVNTFAIEMFKQQLYEINWEEIETNRDPNEAYNIFLQKVLLSYDHYFPEKEIKVTKKDLKSPWITTGIKKSSKRKQRLYEKFLKN